MTGPQPTPTHRERIEGARERLDHFCLVLSESADRFEFGVHTLTTGRRLGQSELTLETVEQLADIIERFAHKWPACHRKPDGHGCLCDECRAFYQTAFERSGIGRLTREQQPPERA